MKIGDLVRYIYPDHMGCSVDLGIIVAGPKRKPRRDQWEVWWMYCNNNDGSKKVGWWDDIQLELVNESR